MLVTEIAEITKSKVKICIDYQISFALYKGELRKYGIKKEEELSEEIYNMILKEVLPKRAKLRCMNLLKSRDYTKFQLEQKLKQNNYPEEVIAEALRYVQSYGYIDDIRYAKNYIISANNSKSRKQITLDLMRKGISKEDIETAYGLCEEEEALIEKLLVKKHYCRQEATLQERQKIIRFLFRKGFSLDKIYKAVGQEY
jgi:regulatory protein